MTKKIDFTKLTNEELAEEMEACWRTYMYYQAAEGNWSAETEARGVATAIYWDCVAECRKRGMESL